MRFDGRCLIRRPLPDYPIRALVPLPAYEHGIAHVRTGQFIIGEQKGLWQAEFPGERLDHGVRGR